MSARELLLLSHKPPLVYNRRNMGDTFGVKTNIAASSNKHHRYAPEIIAHAVWLTLRFSLGCRDVEDLMAIPDVSLSYETVRCWTLRFGQQYANDLGRRRLQPGAKRHVADVFPKINGKTD